MNIAEAKNKVEEKGFLDIEIDVQFRSCLQKLKD